MGQRKFKEFVVSQGLNIVRTLATTGTIIANRVGRLTTAGEFKHTTGSSGRKVTGVALSTGTNAAVQLFGIVDIEASTAAIAKGKTLVATSGAVASTSRLGGTVKVASATTTLNRRWTIGFSLTSAAAGTGRRLVTTFLCPMGLGTTEA